MTYLGKLFQGKSINLVINRGPDKGSYPSVIHQMGERALSIIVPNKNGTPLLLAEGIGVTITFWDQIRAYKFDTRVLGRSSVGIQTFLLELPKEFIEIQRREYVRIDTVIPISYEIIKDQQAQGKWHKAHTLDISAGGLRFVTKERPDADTFNIDLELRNIKINTKAKLCRVEHNDTRQFALAVEFINLKPQERDAIVRYIFELQRERRKKGLI